MNPAGGPVGVGTRSVEALGQSYGGRFAYTGEFLVRAVQIEDKFSVGLDICAAGFGDEAGDTLHAPGFGTGRRWKGTGLGTGRRWN